LDYEREYASSTYGVQIRKKFEEVIALPEEKSDNRQRVKWLEERLKEQPMSSPETRILDVGSGLGVFPI
jgi:2-polyprenyl-3-methyl-5-hydroxy-6-metoxy-1,4-benzoquinol methylase